MGSKNVRPQSYLKVVYHNAHDLEHKDILLQQLSLRRAKSV